MELERRHCEVTYIRTPQDYEVHYPARGEDDHTELIQICTDTSDNATTTRESRALASAGVTFPSTTKRLLTQNHRSLPTEASPPNPLPTCKPKPPTNG